MRAAVVRTFGGPEAVEIADVPVPEPGARQVRIKVAAGALNPVDAAVRAGFLGGAGKALGLGWDVAGTVDAVGAPAAWQVGDPVVALVPGVADPLGAHAEYVVVAADAVAAAPVSVDAVHAGTLPLNGLTALQALDLLDLAPGQKLLVTGAAGAVGGFAVQLAAHRGIEVVGHGRVGDEGLVRSLGAARFTADGIEPGGVDAVLDAAVLGAPALRWVRDGGAFVAVRDGVLPEAERGVRGDNVRVRADGAQLAELVRLVDEGVLTLRVARTYALREAAEAHARLAEGGTRGRLVLVP
ncbi:NADPH:quinone reductase [Streptomyces yokosukanensis]|uniref:NADPH:quinone reductase n=1 Tax=Streptomyces yokosukanensis TaxID=67386 RepID=A0A101PC23_9ACTN|nr:NADP-dependent oxidoreductase [Streptomyces yokosukanensis]KUN08703.1 NADPH:quinone reductase [Streptomyces yokosukanensis]